MDPDQPESQLEGKDDERTKDQALCLLCNKAEVFKIFNEMSFCKTCFETNVELLISYEEAQPVRASLPVEIIPSKLYIGDKNSAVSISALRARDITQVIVAGKLLKTHLKEEGIKYLELPLDDALEEDIKSHFESSLDFIEKGEGATLVHCHGGISRSATIVTAFVMKSQDLGVDEALGYVKSKHSHAFPNSSFLRQLKEFELILKGVTESEAASKENTSQVTEVEG